MAKVYIVMGSTGTGKSRSVKNLNPEETFILNTIGKALPFKGSGKSYNLDKKNMVTSDKPTKINQILVNISEKAPDIKNIILDDIRYVMVEEFFDKAQEKGLNS